MVLSCLYNVFAFCFFFLFLFFLSNSICFSWHCSYEIVSFGILTAVGWQAMSIKKEKI